MCKIKDKLISNKNVNFDEYDAPTKYKVVTTHTDDSVTHCIYPSFQRAFQAMELEKRIWLNFKSVKMLKI